MKNQKENKKYTVFLDFDNTITTYDVLDDILQRFAKDEKWMVLEEMWKKGKIGSRECLKGQIECIRLTKDALDRYLRTVGIDTYFIKLVQFLDSKHVRVVILSDNFDYILNRILRHNNVSVSRELEIFCNRLKIVKDRLVPEFPYKDRSCGDCAHCKKSSLKKLLEPGHMSIYVGDGKSDVCVSEVADVVLAKGYLKDYLKGKREDHVPFNDMRDVYSYLRKIL